MVSTCQTKRGKQREGKANSTEHTYNKRKICYLQPKLLHLGGHRLQPVWESLGVRSNIATAVAVSTRA